MNKVLVLLIASVFAWQVHAAPPKGGAATLAVKGASALGLLGKDAQYAAECETLAARNLPYAERKAAEAALRAKYNRYEPLDLSSLAKPTPAELKAAQERAKLQADWNELEKRGQALKAKDKTYIPPWRPEANRLDWKARDTILQANKPLTVDELTKALKIKPEDMTALLIKDEMHQRKVFFRMSDGKVWVSGSKLPLAPAVTIKPTATLADVFNGKK